jgi:cytochrome c biogenesis protein CcmG/thiol:disulfide interchange protein DsbE
VKHRARWIALTAGVVVVALGVVLALNVGSDPQADASHSALVGNVAPSFSVTTLAGQKLSRDSVAGKAVVVNFWNTWCVPCQTELPALKQFYAEHASDPDFVMVGIVRDDVTRTVRAFVQGEGLGWTIATDPDNQAALAFATRGQPETYVISPGGLVAAAQIGPTTVHDLNAMLAAARSSP